MHLSNKKTIVIMECKTCATKLEFDSIKLKELYPLTYPFVPCLSYQCAHCWNMINLTAIDVEEEEEECQSET